MHVYKLNRSGKVVNQDGNRVRGAGPWMRKLFGGEKSRCEYEAFRLLKRNAAKSKKADADDAIMLYMLMRRVDLKPEQVAGLLESIKRLEPDVKSKLRGLIMKADETDAYRIMLAFERIRDRETGVPAGFGENDYLRIEKALVGKITDPHLIDQLHVNCSMLSQKIAYQSIFNARK